MTNRRFVIELVDAAFGGDRLFADRPAEPVDRYRGAPAEPLPPPPPGQPENIARAARSGHDAVSNVRLARRNWLVVCHALPYGHPSC